MCSATQDLVVLLKERKKGALQTITDECEQFCQLKNYVEVGQFGMQQQKRKTITVFQKWLL
eukprot:m.130877 g.130877  ORF g.130877 m.130877 type:complete len:61 (-) comp9473_c0_seq14:971-1153(-)